ncbi:MAG: metallophosphoesterase [Thermoplasmata archaeon]|uniref:Metallophosphoesterase n=1 Tax=Candidatus Sysuiplasma superficiale TaxID=2823368 RepID=A0A8J7YL49_9ARCH|nr:metallophosphoesterase [Candidatus Sysuiplasma superficiale]MBX8645037.1 metallophosphoesterase [Candidatus Sysuiplasma superficiale]
MLVLGGDITGKLLVPIVKQDDGSYSSEFHGTQVRISSETERSEFEKKVKFSGYYPVLMEKAEYERALTDGSYRESVFEETMLDSIKGWLKLADERLKGTKVKLYITAGNDDLLSMDEILRNHNSENVEYAEGEIASFDGFEMLSMGDVNPTPWHTPREYPEEELERRLEALASKLTDPSKSIFNVHVPPIGVGLDVCPELDANLTPVTRGGEIVMKAAGSVAVKRAIEKFEPLLGLHGHIHESPGIARIGRTVCINPGSEYGQGVLRGALVSFDKGKLKHYSLTRG